MSTGKGWKFAPGVLVTTPGAFEALGEAEQAPSEFLLRHGLGDWGELCEDDWNANEVAIEFEHLNDDNLRYRILSSYLTKKGTKIWIITEYDRSVTTMLLPSEY